MAWFVGWKGLVSPSLVPNADERARYDAMSEAVAQRLKVDWVASGHDLHFDVNSEQRELLNSKTGGAYWPNFRSKGPSVLDGWRWPIPEQPFRDRMKTVPKAIKDVINTTFDAYAVSQKVIDCIEAIEPSVHQYLPYELMMPDGSISPDRRWLLNVCTRIQAIDESRSNVVSGATGVLGDYPTRHLVMSRSAIAGRALWHEYRYSWASRPVVSDAFWDTFRKNKCSGWSVQFGYPQFAEE